MVKQTKKLTAVLLSLLMLLSSFPLISFAADEYDVGNGVVVASETCTNSNCDFSYTIYENGLLVVDGNSSHTHRIPTNNVEKVYIGDNAQNIDGALFGYLSTVKEYTVSSDNENYTSVDGVLYSKDMTTLYAYPQGRTDSTFTIPNTVKKIGNVSFYNCKLTSIVIPKSVKWIFVQAFQSSLSLSSVTFESGERNLIISSLAFSDCTALNSISLYGNRVYAVACSAFRNTAYYNNENNWENGVLYLNDILLNTKPSELNSEYTIKDGTTTIADEAAFIYYPEESSNSYEYVYVTIPETVDNIGIASIYSYNKLPVNLFRVGSLATSPSSICSKFLSDMLEVIEDDFNNYFNNKYKDYDTLPTEAMVELYQFVLYGTKDNWIYYLEAIPNNVIFMKEGIVGIADNTTPMITSFPLRYVFLDPTYFNGLILPKTFANLTCYTELCDYYTRVYVTSAKIESFDTEKSVTFLNPDCKIFDDENTLWVGYTICGYKGSTAEAYAKKYNRKFVAIDDCKHETTCRNAVIEATCGNEGYTGDLYCQYCGELLENGKLTDKTENHNFGEPKQLTYATCTEWGTAEYTCKDCGTTKVMDYEEPTGHTYIYNYSFDADCIYDGYVASYCYCGAYKKTITEPALGHIDENHDLHCDRCGEKFRDCDCMCHKSGFSGFIYKLIKIFWKLFRTNQTCECGASHY